MGISLSGLGSGFDWRSVVDQLRQVENQKLNSLGTQKARYDNKLSSWKTLTTKLEALKKATQDLKDANDFDVFKTTLTSSSPSGSADSILAVEVGAGAARGRYDIVVSRMARAEKLQSAALYDDASTTLGKTGSLAINGKALNLDGTESLSGIQEKINALDAGVVASVLRDSDGKYRLTLTSDTEGEAGIALTDLAEGGALFAATPLQKGVDAEFTVDGIPMKSASNKVADAIPGLILDIRAEDAATTLSLHVNRDQTAIQEKVQKFVDAYNDLSSFFSQHMTFDASTRKAGGALFGDATLKSVKTALQMGLSGTGLASRGISLGKENLLSLDADKLTSALNLDFRGTLTAFNGIAAGLEAGVNKFTDYVNGGVTVQQNTLQTAMKNLDRRIATTQEFIDRKMEMLTNQFIALDGALSKMQSTSSWLSTQLGSLSSSSGSN
jgi:flagellar hook-associated protein 2